MDKPNKHLIFLQCVPFNAQVDLPVMHYATRINIRLVEDIGGPQRVNLLKDRACAFAYGSAPAHDAIH